jgi:uncharacterized hydrophobic protein (TIGR00271 family)
MEPSSAPLQTGPDLTSDEFQDYEGPLAPPGLGFDISRLLTAESLRGVAAVVVSILVLRTPSRSIRSFAVLLAIILLAWALGGLFELRDPTKRTGWAVIRLLFLTVFGVGLLLDTGFSGVGLSRAAGVALIAIGALNAVRGIRASDRNSRVEPLLEALLYVALGVALVVAPLSVMGLAVLLVAVYWFLAGIATVVVNLRLDDRQIAPSNTWQMFLEWIQTRPNTADDRKQLYEKLFFEGEESPRRLSRFFSLMGFATAIATFGVISDSTAVVIGAMLVAPLMTPLMGTSLGMTMGWPRRAVMSGGVALAGIVFAVGLGILFGWMYGPEVSTVTNSQVASRIGPTLVDLLIAVAAGGAGAFALSRPDVSDSLPGVAVAIALVPPLAVVGLMISQGAWTAASGALLLFITNMVAILLIGGIVFVLTGVVPVLRLSENTAWVKRSLGMVAVLGITVVAILGGSAETFRRQTAGLAKAEVVVDGWIEGTDLTVQSSDYDGEVYRLVLTGSDSPPPIDELGSAIEDALGEAFPISVTLIPTENLQFLP